MLVAVALSDVLIGSGTTSLGLVIGALLERWRDDTKWKRDEAARWTGDLRVLYRDLIASGDEFVNRLWHSRNLEAVAKSGRLVGAEAREHHTRLLTDALEAMDRAQTKVLAISAEVQLIGSERESEVTAGFALQILAGTVLTLDENWDAYRLRYHEAKKDLVAVARSSLRRV